MKKRIKKLIEKLPFVIVGREELLRLRNSEATWKTAIKSLEDHNERQRQIPLCETCKSEQWACPNVD